MSWRSSARLSRRRKLTLNHPIFTRWPTQYSDRLQLFSAPTPNGVKVGSMLEETSLAMSRTGSTSWRTKAMPRPLSRSTPTARLKEAHEDSDHHCRHLLGPCHLDGRHRRSP